MKPTISFKVIKGRRYILIRNDKGKVISRRLQKGSGFKSKKDAYKKFRKDNTLAKNTKRISKKNPIIDGKDTQRIQFKGKDKSKTLNLSKAQLKNASRIGKNTVSIRTQNKIKGNNYNQYVVSVKWGDTATETIGFSDIRGTKKQAFTRARTDAITKGLISYNHQITIRRNGTGVAYLVRETDAKKRLNVVTFTYDYSIQTYINTTKKLRKRK